VPSARLRADRPLKYEVNFSLRDIATVVLP
jgi:hypothetical protein